VALDSHHRPVFMERGFIGLIILLGLLLALNVKIGGIVAPLFWLFIISGFMSRLVRGKLPDHFFISLLGLLIGPFLICCLITMLMRYIDGRFGSDINTVASAGALLILMTISFLYVRRRILGARKPEAKDLQTNERRPLLPPHHENDPSGGHDHARH
jgi:hypothetical protein